MSAARFDEILGATLASLRDNIEGDADQVERDEQAWMIDWIDRFIRGRSIARSLTEHAQRLACPLSERERTMLARWEWRQWQNGGVGWPGQLPDHVAKDGIPRHPWSFSRADGAGDVWMRACRPCPACSRHGQPTGTEP